MKTATVCILAAVAVLVAGGLAWRYLSPSAPPPAVTKSLDGFPLVCKECNHFFVVPQDQIHTYPAAPDGTGFKCEKCGKLSARVGRQCEKCQKWFIAESRGVACPYCRE